MTGDEGLEAGPGGTGRPATGPDAAGISAAGKARAGRTATGNAAAATYAGLLGGEAGVVPGGVAFTAGTVVSLLATAADAVVGLGTVTGSEAGPAGLVVTLRVATAPDVARVLAGHRVWVSGSTTDDDLVVLAAVARVAPGGLELTGVASLAHERRRGAVRAPVDAAVSLRCASGSYSATTLDLSHSGCRVRIDAGDGEPLPEPGDTVELTIGVSTDMQVHATGVVVRREGDDVALRFTALPTLDEVRIDQTVFGHLGG